MSNVLVSVLIPVYNTEKYIEETINSVLNQTHANFELIVVDDGSTDSTALLVEKFCKIDARVKLIRQKNQGVSAARNTGFNASKGDFIAYLDADDVWRSKNLELWLQKFASDDDFGVVHSDCQVIDSNSNKVNTFHHGYEGYLLDNLLLGGKWINGTSGSLVKRKIVESVGGFDLDLSTGADQEFFFRIASKGKVGRVAEVLWYYRIHSNNMHYNTKLYERDTLLAYKRAKQNKLFKTSAFQRLCFSKMYYMLSGTYWNLGGNKIKAITYLAKSILYYPPIIINILKKI
jgi:glycosyltransferase involved in cell wall biosynthesis